MWRIISIIGITFLFSCSSKIINERKNYDINNNLKDSINQNSNAIKIHLKSGKLAVLESWIIDNNNQQISGKGKIYSPERNPIIEVYKDEELELTTTEKENLIVRIPFESCVLVETNEYRGFNVISPVLLTFSTMLSVISLPCLVDPKACFGSCPTFYLHQDGKEILKAEGFSSSITKSMESTDIDFITDIKTSDTISSIQIELKNEAYETHYIKQADIISVEKGEDEFVRYGGDNQFYITSKSITPNQTSLKNDSILHLFQKQDNKEYLPKCDSNDIMTKQSIIFDFKEMDAQNTGVVITQRQSFMTTYLFYQSMAHMGTKAGDFIAKYENSSPLVRSAYSSINDILGGVEVEAYISNKWKKIGILKEQGPIVCDTHILPVNKKGKVSKVKITMTKGLWRIDQIGLCTIIRKGKPLIIQANKLIDKNIENCELLTCLNNIQTAIVNLPGTTYTLEYQIPTNINQSIFIKSKGYYTEWMRKEWLQEENREMTELIVYDPKEWLRLMTPGYKTIEQEIETMFWASKFAK